MMTQEQEMAFKLGMATGKLQKIIDFCENENTYFDDLKEVNKLLLECGSYFYKPETKHRAETEILSELNTALTENKALRADCLYLNKRIERLRDGVKYFSSCWSDPELYAYKIQNLLQEKAVSILKFDDEIANGERMFE